MNVITYKNQPVIKEWMSEGEKEFRKNIEDFTSNAIQQNQTLFLGDEITVTFFQKGVASVVGLLVQKDKKYVLKTCYKAHRAEIEAAVFKMWRDEGIATPYIFAQGSVNDFTYFIMEYIEAPTLLEVITEYPTKREEILKSIGKLFFKIHQVKIEGFSPLRMIDGKLRGSFDSSADYLDSYFMKEISDPNARELADFCCSILLKHCKEEATIGHFDFGPKHIFSGSTVVVFDPDPQATFPIMDLVFFILPEPYRTDDTIENSRIIFQEYLKETNKPIDLDIFAAALILQIFKKAHALLERPDEKRQKRAEYMLSQISTLEKAKEYIQTYL
jgi:hypothetical protein